MNLPVWKKIIELNNATYNLNYHTEFFLYEYQNKNKIYRTDKYYDTLNSVKENGFVNETCGECEILKEWIHFFNDNPHLRRTKNINLGYEFDEKKKKCFVTEKENFKIKFFSEFVNLF